MNNVAPLQVNFPCFASLADVQAAGAAPGAEHSQNIQQGELSKIAF
jgi:hypothetical protein